MTTPDTTVVNNTVTTNTYPAWLRLLGGRKFLICLAVLGSATWLVANKHIADGVYSAVIIATAAAFVAGNVAQKATAKATTDANTTD